MSPFSNTALVLIPYRKAMLRTLALLLFAIGAHAAGLPALSWMSGCWSMNSGPMTIDEQWTKPAAGTLLGSSRTIKEGRTVFHEFMRIEQRGAEITYTPRIGTKAEPVSFRLIKQTADEVIFENRAHDFPQRIIYRKVPGGLQARIEGLDKGKPRAEDFPYKRVACE
jgi:hypothetical protein